MVAYTGAAGKYDPQAPMSGNEDNFYVDDNLSDNIPSHCSADDIIDMNECGCIMAVCDGMGGMNAGEVASAIAVHTIQDYFAPNNVSKDIAISAKEREKYLENVVVEADKRIKEDATSISLLSNPPKFVLEIREDALDQIAKELIGENK